MSDFEMVIGIEVHAQLTTNTKLFCGCSTRFGNAENTNVCPVCLGMPGALPVLNKRAVDYAIMAGLALGCDIQPKSVFSRKNYFYPDLPKGYQISQYDLPICLGGHVDVVTEDGQSHRIGITRIHMEEDAGKLVHSGADGIAGSDSSSSDLNRACVPLLEIVSEPDMRSAEQAKAYILKLREVLRHIGVNDGNLEEGSMRADVNISLRPKGQSAFGTRAEIKNINSFRALERAIAYEFDRQADLLRSGKAVDQETRNYDDKTQSTTVLRSKENSPDYRYFPDPDLIPLLVTDSHIEAVRSEMPELPHVKRERYMTAYGLGEFECGVLMDDLVMNAYFEKCLSVADGVSPKEICKWVIGDVNSLLKDKGVSFAGSPVTELRLVTLLRLIDSGKVSGKMAKDILLSIFNDNKDPERIVKESGAEQISDTSALEDVVKKVMASNPDVVDKIKGGKAKSIDFLMGQVMKETRGQAKPDLVKELLQSLILG